MNVSARALLSAPVFLIGSMRSGTTLLAELLGQFQGIIHCPFELKDVWSSVGGVPMASAKTRDMVCYQVGADDVKPGQAVKLSSAFLKRMRQNSSGKKEDAIFLNKNPHLCNKLPFVNALFPDARFIWIHRPLPHVVASLRKLFEDVFNRQQTWHYWPELQEGTTERCWYAFHQKEIPNGVDRQRLFPGGNIQYLAKYWLESNRAVANFFLTLHRKSHIEIDEIELINNPGPQIERCLSFLHQQEEISAEIFKNLDPSRNDKWKALMSDEDRRTFQFFIETHKDDIRTVFPSQNYDGLATSKTLTVAQEIVNITKRASKANLQKQKNQAVCITGMHRSGTSMVARLLNVCGLYLGEEKDILKASPENPKGFWENINFLNLNDKVLSTFGGAWDFPPVNRKGWENSPKVVDLRKRAFEIVADFKDQKAWGWKDPRNCLTLPFWKSILPDLKFVICLRNPIEVARSLHRRNNNSYALALNLWLTYYQRLLALTNPDDQIVTHYESYFLNPQTEVKRITNFLGLTVSDEELDEACSKIIPSLRHHVLTISDLKKNNVPGKVIGLYKALCKKAGTVYEQVLAQQKSIQQTSQQAPLNHFVIQDSTPKRLSFENEDYVRALEQYLYSKRAYFRKHVDTSESDNRIKFYIEKFEQYLNCTEIFGWAHIIGHSSVQCEIFIILKAEEKSYLFETIPVARPDVTAYFNALNYDNSGFSAMLPNKILDKGEYKVIIYIKKGTMKAFQDTERRIIIK